MNGRPLISVITICRNAEKHITGTMRSVLEQSYENIEHILIDGHSSDGTMELIQAISREYPERKLVWISEPDQGIAEAMNKGVKLASGEIVTHLHAGDRYVDGCAIERVVESYVRDRWRWGIAGSIVVDAKGNEIHRYKAAADWRVLLHKNCIPHQSTFLVKDIFEKHGDFRVNYNQAMDYEFWLRIALRGGERYAVLPFNTTYFLNGGRSGDLGELLLYLWRLRRSLSSHGVKKSYLSDVVFVFRVLVFGLYMRLKDMLTI